jgi:hypothetical protein
MVMMESLRDGEARVMMMMEDGGKIDQTAFCGSFTFARGHGVLAVLTYDPHPSLRGSCLANSSAAFLIRDQGCNLSLCPQTLTLRARE